VDLGASGISCTTVYSSSASEAKLFQKLRTIQKMSILEQGLYSLSMIVAGALSPSVCLRNHPESRDSVSPGDCQ